MHVGFLGKKFLVLSFAKRREGFTTLYHSIMHSAGQSKKNEEGGIGLFAFNSVGCNKSAQCPLGYDFSSAEQCNIGVSMARCEELESSGAKFWKGKGCLSDSPGRPLAWQSNVFPCLLCSAVGWGELVPGTAILQDATEVLPCLASQSSCCFCWGFWQILHPTSRNEYCLPPLQTLCLVKTKWRCWVVSAMNNPSYIYCCTLNTTYTDLSSQSQTANCAYCLQHHNSVLWNLQQFLLS